MRRLIPVLILILLLLPACAPSGNFSAGRPLTKDDLASLSAELFTQPEEPTTEDATKEPSPNREPVTVYWTEEGSVYHSDKNCYHLKSAKSVRSGTLLTARMNGKEKACSHCGED